MIDKRACPHGEGDIHWFKFPYVANRSIWNPFAAICEKCGITISEIFKAHARDQELIRGAKGALELVEIILLFYGRSDPGQHDKTCTAIKYPDWPANRYQNRWCPKCQYEGLRKSAYDAEQEIKRVHALLETALAQAKERS